MLYNKIPQNNLYNYIADHYKPALENITDSIVIGAGMEYLLFDPEPWTPNIVSFFPTSK